MLSSSLLLMDECPPDRCLFHYGLVAIVREGSKQGLPTVGHHRDMYDARLAPHTGLQPGEGFALWGGAVVVGHGAVLSCVWAAYNRFDGGN